MTANPPDRDGFANGHASVQTSNYRETKKDRLAGPGTISKIPSTPPVSRSRASKKKRKKGKRVSTNDWPSDREFDVSIKRHFYDSHEIGSGKKFVTSYVDVILKTKESETETFKDICFAMGA